MILRAMSDPGAAVVAAVGLAVDNAVGVAELATDAGELAADCEAVPPQAATIATRAIQNSAGVRLPPISCAQILVDRRTRFRPRPLLAEVLCPELTLRVSAYLRLTADLSRSQAAGS
jgi:hypothetical protein